MLYLSMKSKPTNRLDLLWGLSDPFQKQSFLRWSKLNIQYEPMWNISWEPAHDDCDWSIFATATSLRNFAGWPLSEPSGIGGNDDSVDPPPEGGGRHLWYCYDMVFSLKKTLVNVRLFWDLTNLWLDYDITPPGGEGSTLTSFPPVP